MQESDAMTPMTLDISELAAHEGRPLGTTAWRIISQDDVDTFAKLTGDEQWIHVDPVRAKLGPFGTTIAHGYFTLSLSTVCLDEVVDVTGAQLVLNYGSNRIRYPAPVPTGSRVRAAIDLAAVRPIDGGVETTYRLTFEVDGGRKPGCVADIVYRYYAELPAGRNAGQGRGA